MKALVFLGTILLLGCSDKVEPRCNDVTRASNDCTVMPDGDLGDLGDQADQGDLVDLDTDVLDGATDAASDLDTDPDSETHSDAELDSAEDVNQDATLTDMEDGGTDADLEEDTGPSAYDETGWTMKQNVISDSASTGTPDSYFYDVDAGSPLSASITGGGTGTWSVNVFGGYSNMLYCTGTPDCQVMLRPEDTTVIVTAITTGIGSYSLTIRFAGDGRQ